MSRQFEIAFNEFCIREEQRRTKEIKEIEANDFEDDVIDKLLIYYECEEQNINEKFYPLIAVLIVAITYFIGIVIMQQII